MQAEYYTVDGWMLEAGSRTIRAQNARWAREFTLTARDIDAMTPDRLVEICNWLCDAIEQP